MPTVIPERHVCTQEYALQINSVPNTETILTAAYRLGRTENRKIGTRKIEIAPYYGSLRTFPSLICNLRPTFIAKVRNKIMESFIRSKQT